MKKIAAVTIGVLLLSFNISFSQTTNKNLSQLFDEYAFDKYFTIERAAAIEFHSLINQYRIDNGSGLLVWDDDLWLAARNHCLYMYYNNHLTHSQVKYSKGFSGNTPEDRYVFATNGNPKYAGTGENCLYNSSSEGDDLEEIAQNIANKSFDQWQSSPRHNSAMLYSYYRRHGVAFLVGGGKVWGADVFSLGLRHDYYDTDDKYTRHKKQSLYAIQKEVKFEVMKEILSSLKKKVKQNQKLYSEANRKVRAIIHVKAKTKELQNVLYEKQDIIQSNGFLGLFSKNRNRYSIVIEKNKYELNQDEIVKELVSLIKENQNIDNLSKIGLSVAIIKRKKGIRIALVSIIA